MRSDKRMIAGLFFLLLGTSILLKVLFKIDLPLVRLCFAVFLIYMGIRMLTGTFTKPSQVFSQGVFDFDESEAGLNHYNAVFGRRKIDLTRIVLDKQDVKVEINTVFGESTVLINPAMPITIHTNAVFSEARMPNENMVTFGTLKYSTSSAKSAPHTLIVHSNVVFGALRFVDKLDDK